MFWQGPAVDENGLFVHGPIRNQAEHNSAHVSPRSCGDGLSLTVTVDRRLCARNRDSGLVVCRARLPEFVRSIRRAYRSEEQL